RAQALQAPTATQPGGDGAEPARPRVTLGPARTGPAQGRPPRPRVTAWVTGPWVALVDGERILLAEALSNVVEVRALTGGRAPEPLNVEAPIAGIVATDDGSAIVVL